MKLDPMERPSTKRDWGRHFAEHFGGKGHDAPGKKEEEPKRGRATGKPSH